MGRAASIVRISGMITVILVLYSTVLSCGTVLALPENPLDSAGPGLPGTSHFIITVAPDVKGENVPYIRKYLENAYTDIGHFLDHYPNEKLVAVVYSGKNYNKLLGNRPYWTLMKFDGKLRIPSPGSVYTEKDTIRIIYHEYAHAVVYDIAGRNVPLWLNEGIAAKAEYIAEGKERSLPGDHIKRFGLVPYYRIPASFTSGMDPDIAGLLYMESYLLADFIIKRTGIAGLKDILSGLGRGMDIDKVFENVLKTGRDEFESSWEDYIRERCGLKDIRYL